MTRAVLGDFDVDSTLSKSSSITMYVLFQLAVVILMMNLIIAIMAGASCMTVDHELGAGSCFSNPRLR